MPTIRVKENEPFETALRRFKQKAAAIKRHYKRLRSQMLPKKLY